MTADKAQVDQQLKALLKRISGKIDNFALPNAKPIDCDVSELVVRFNKQHGSDVGCFVPFLLNCFSCQPGEAIFLAPDEPHAYISGDIIEVMACSDNVVRAGLTPKMRDTQTLCDMLTYNTGMAEIQTGQKVDKFTVNYGPPASHASVITEFRQSRTNLTAADGKYNLPQVNSHALLLVYKGSGSLDKESIKEGDVLFVPKDTTVSLQAATDLLVFRCHAGAHHGKPKNSRSCAQNFQQCSLM